MCVRVCDYSDSIIELSRFYYRRYNLYYIARNKSHVRLKIYSQKLKLRIR